jgi:hypothetical protein
MNKNWSAESGGATEFIIDEGTDTTLSIYPIWNRMLSFPANIKHRALPFFKLGDFRITLAIKTEKIEQKIKDVEKYQIKFL